MFDVSRIGKISEVKAPSLNDIPIEMPRLAQKKEDEFMNFWDGLRGEKFAISKEDASNAPKEGSNGHWGGDRGDSTWYPDPDYTPPEKKANSKSNPDGKTMEDLFKKHGGDVNDGVLFKDGDLDLSEFSVGTVEIDDFSGDRTPNFNQADKKLSEAEGGARTPEEIKKWWKENNYTWHESQDRKTMYLVPHEIHANITHKGGVSIERKEIADKFGCTQKEVQAWIKANGSSWRACKDIDSIDIPKKDEPSTDSNE